MSEQQRKPRLRPRFTRRALLRASLSLPPALFLAACASDETDQPVVQATRPAEPGEQTAPATQQTAPATQQTAPATQQTAQATTTGGAVTLQPTPECGDDDEPTIAQMEGPFFTPSSPERTSLLEPGIAGSVMVLTGTVLTTDCRPVAGALIDFWHADDAGAYDNVGFRLRGHQFSDAAGGYRLETIVPGLYSGRTRHFHVKVQAPNSPILTTQLYFPDEPANDRDGLFSSALVIDLQEGGNGKTASFNFVLDLA